MIETWCNKEPNSYGFVVSDKVKGQIFAPSHNFLTKVRDTDVAAGKTKVEFYVVRGVRKQDDVTSEWKAERIRILSPTAPSLSSSSSSSSTSFRHESRRGDARGSRDRSRERSPERRHRKDSLPSDNEVQADEHKNFEFNPNRRFNELSTFPVVQNPNGLRSNEVSRSYNSNGCAR
ncbi:hypothetical protein BASA81_017384 [Batrachochytrium salamandrivorans]|nr:hypothetical protein BASA81_017384 [Batrachochytrium salamandrivorans]